MAKRTVNLPKLEVDPISREEGAPLTNGGEKGRAQQQYLKFIEPIINENIDLPFGEYMRLALHDAGTYKVVGKKNGANGSIRFELDRPENADCKEAFESIERIKKKIDAVVNQPISYADIIAIVPHFAARIQFEKDYYEVMGEDDPNYEFLFVGTNPYLGAKVRIGRRAQLRRHRAHDVVLPGAADADGVPDERARRDAAGEDQLGAHQEEGRRPCDVRERRCYDHDRKGLQGARGGVG